MGTADKTPYDRTVPGVEEIVEMYLESGNGVRDVCLHLQDKSGV